MGKTVGVTLSKDYPVRVGSILIKKGAKLEVSKKVECALEKAGLIDKRKRTAE